MTTELGKSAALANCEPADGSSNMAGVLLPPSDGKHNDPAGTSIESVPLKGVSLLKRKTKSLLAAAIHPKEAAKAHIQTKISSKISAFNSDPFHVRENDVEFVEAAYARDAAQNFDEFQEHNAKLEELLEARKKYLVAWATKRHLHYVRAIQKEIRPWPDTEKFYQKSEFGRPKFDYVGWVGQFLLFITQSFSPRYISSWEEVPPVNEVQLRSDLQRFLIGTGPWQEWFMHVRRVYRWERPEETCRWLVLYIVLWYYQYLITFIYLYIIYYVLRKRYRPTTANDIRESFWRAQSMGEHAYHLAEAIEKHGNDKLLETLWEEIGPLAQLQLGNMANLLEVLRNFYEWRSPQDTAYTLVFFGVCAAMGLLTDMKYCFKTATFIIGFGFFFYFPISSRYPRYRYIASPLKWVLWGIPTHIEFACQELREEARQRRDAIVLEGRGHANVFQENTANSANYWEEGKDSSDDNFDEIFYDSKENWYTADDSATGIAAEAEQEKALVSEPNRRTNLQEDKSASPHHPLKNEDADNHENLVRNKISMFHCQVQGHLGLLYLTLDGLVFETKVRKKILLRRRWEDIRFLRKESAVSLGPVSAPESIVLGFISRELLNSPGDDEVRINVYHRNEAFNRIIGFSGLQFSTD